MADRDGHLRRIIQVMKVRLNMQCPWFAWSRPIVGAPDMMNRFIYAGCAPGGGGEGAGGETLRYVACSSARSTSAAAHPPVCSLFSTTGRKQELIDRIVSDLEVVGDGARLDRGQVPLKEARARVDRVLSSAYGSASGGPAQTFRALYGMDAARENIGTNGPISGPTDGTNGTDGGRSAAQASTADPPVVVNCICKNKGTMPGMLRCGYCWTSQHGSCAAGDRGNGAEAIDAATYFCETCRFKLADPFVHVREELVPMAKMRDIPGMPPIVDTKGNYHARIKIEQQFYVTSQQLAMCNMKMSRTRVLVMCLQLEDAVTCRMHWPKNVQMRVNNMSIKPYARGVGSEMGINQRDNVVDITRMLCQGRNSVNITAVHAGTWVIRVVIADRLGLEEIKPMMMREETLEEARARMAKLLASTDGVGGADDELGLEQVTFSLKDPLTCMRMAVPARFEGASGTQAFDLDSFLSMAEVNRKWQDPTTLKNSTVNCMRVDSYVRELERLTKDTTNVTNFEVNAAGDWRPEGYTDGWFDVRAMDSSAQEKLTLWAQMQIEMSSNDTDETLDYHAVCAEGIDVRNEVNEAASALLSARKHIPPGSATVPETLAVVSNTTTSPSARMRNSLIPLRVTGKKRPAVEVIDLCDSD